MPEACLLDRAVILQGPGPQSHMQPAAYFHWRQTSPLLHSPVLHSAVAGSLQSLPTQCGNRAPSPENHSVLQTRSSRLSAISPDLPSGTISPHPPRCADPAQTSPQSGPLAANTRALHSLPRCMPLPPLPPEPCSLLDPAHTSAGLLLASRWAEILSSPAILQEPHSNC